MAGVQLRDLLVKKRDGLALTETEIRALVQGLTTGRVCPAQTGALLMAMFLNGLSAEETVALTRCMMESGEVLSWPEQWRGRVVDKHSTGGVGDKVSLVLAPALAACGLKVPMISGRGLGHTGGTLDKLESIPGYKVMCSSADIHAFLQEVGACIVGQTDALVPADKILYATRDITGTVENMALIITSIMSKKAAEGLDALVIELTHGKASLVKNEREARQMADSMIRMGRSLGIKTSALLVRMDNPIGLLVGNALEVVEAVQCLQDGGPPDLRHLVCRLGGQLLKDTGVTSTTDEGALKLEQSLKDGSARQKFIDMLVAQGVTSHHAHALFTSQEDMYGVLPQAKHITEVRADVSGCVHGLDALACGRLVHQLGAGREVPGQTINHAVGLELAVQPGDHLSTGDVWAKIHHDSALSDQQLNLLKSAIDIKDKPLSRDELSLIVDVIGD